MDKDQKEYQAKHSTSRNFALQKRTGHNETDVRRTQESIFIRSVRLSQLWLVGDADL